MKPFFRLFLLPQNIIEYLTEFFEPERFGNSRLESESFKIGHHGIVGGSSGYNGFGLRIQLQQTPDGLLASHAIGDG